jgi:WD40 repeat protein
VASAEVVGHAKENTMKVRLTVLLVVAGGFSRSASGTSLGQEIKERATLKGHSKPVSVVAFSHDSKLLASGSNDKTIRLWDVVTAREKVTLKGHTESVWSVLFTPDGKTLASGSIDSTVRLWDVASCKERATLKGHTGWIHKMANYPG